MRILLLALALIGPAFAGTVRITNGGYDNLYSIAISAVVNGTTVTTNLGQYVTVLHNSTGVVAIPDFYVDGSGTPWPIKMIIYWESVQYGGTYHNNQIVMPAGYVYAMSTGWDGAWHADLSLGGSASEAVTGLVSWAAVWQSMAMGFAVVIVPFGLWWVMWAVRKGISLGGEI